MKYRRIEDNSARSKEYFEEIPNIVSIVADKTLAQLEKEGIFVFPDSVKEASDLEEEQMILQSRDDCYWSSNVMGYIGFDDERLSIVSRFSERSEDYFFHYMLEKVFDFPNISNLETNAANDKRLLALLIFLFPKYLADAVRKGIFKTYVWKNYNDSNIKGRINIGYHIKQNVPFVGKVAYDQREHTTDNPLMQLVRHTIEFIKCKPYGGKILGKVKDEVALVIEATPSYESRHLRKVLLDNQKKTVRHAYFREYQDLQRLCIMILQNEKHQLGVGRQKIFGILFDGAWLWEEYINLLVHSKFYHPMNKAKKEGQHLFTGRSRVEGLIYPDFIGRSAEKRIIADAKYKRIEAIKNLDYFQVLAYMYRFDAKLGYYFYPEANNETAKKLWLNSGSTYEKNVKQREDICLVKYGLQIPADATSFEDFTAKIRIEEARFCAGIGIG